MIEKIKSLRHDLMAKYRVWDAHRDPTFPPILVYQMGKVGSSTVVRSLKGVVPNRVFHFHCLSDQLAINKRTHEEAGRPTPYNTSLQDTLLEFMKKNPVQRYKIITLVRDPIAFFVSNLFQNPWLVGENIYSETGDIDAVKAALYLNQKIQYPNAFEYLNNWFDRELNSVFDIDVFAEDFPKDQGYAFYHNERADVLLIRLEDLDTKWSEAISGLLDIDGAIPLEYGNVRKESSDAIAYRQTLDALRIDIQTCEKIYAGRLARHFYSDSMIEKMKSKWCSA